MRVALVLLALVTACTPTLGEASIDGAVLDPADPRRLTLQVVHGGCEELRNAQVDEQGGAVRVHVPVEVKRDDCADVGILVDVPVQLATPLGSRQVRTDQRTLDVVGRDRCRPNDNSDATLLGLAEAQARARHGSKPFRVTCRDGVVMNRAADYQPQRLNVSVDDGTVTATSLG